MRWAIAVLTAAAAMVAALNEVASLARFAAEKLHFPDGLAWTLPGMVTIATLAGALMWTVLRDTALRGAGRRLNIVCAAISATAVGLDHASGAAGWWMVPAGLVGALVPALATWLTHLLARMTADPVGDSAGTNPQRQDDTAASVGVSAAVPAAVADLVSERAPLHSVPTNAIPTPPQGIPAVAKVSPARTTAPTASARVEDVGKRAAELIAGGAGRTTLVKELGVTPHQARTMLEKAKA